MQVPQAKLAQRRLVRPEAISHELLWLDRLISEETSKQPQCRVGVPPSLDDNVQHLAFIINRPPQKHALSTDRANDFVEMPARRRGGAKLLQPPGDLRSKLDRPAADRLVAQIDSALPSALQRHEG